MSRQLMILEQSLETESPETLQRSYTTVSPRFQTSQAAADEKFSCVELFSCLAGAEEVFR